MIYSFHKTQLLSINNIAIDPLGPLSLFWCYPVSSSICLNRIFISSSLCCAVTERSFTVRLHILTMSTQTLTLVHFLCIQSNQLTSLSLSENTAEDFGYLAYTNLVCREVAIKAQHLTNRLCQSYFNSQHTMLLWFLITPDLVHTSRVHISTFTGYNIIFHKPPEYFLVLRFIYVETGLQL